jgi:hypothetical protein
VTVIPNNALSRPAYKPARPSRSTMRLMACRVLVSDFLDSTWALVERVIKGYLPLRLSFAVLVCFYYRTSRASGHISRQSH